MSRRHRSEPPSPRALARLRTPRRGYVPTEDELTSARSSESHSRLPARAAGARAGSRDVEAVWAQDDDDGWGGSRQPADTETEDDLGAPRRALRSAAERPHGNRDPLEDDRERGGWRGAFRLPAAFVGARWEPGRLAVIGLVLVVAVAVAVFGLRVAWASSDSTVLAPGGGSRAGPSGISAGSAPVGAAPSATAGAGVSPSPGAAATSSPTGAALVVVHVVGQVREPGVQQLPAGSRVADALAAAGGATRRADLARVNLARVLVDGEQVVVPAPGDPDPVTAPPAGGAGSGGTAGGAGAGPAAPVSLNSADLAGLDTLPGVGPVLAQRILDWRSEHGRFTSVDELGEVSGIGEKLMERLRPLVTL